MLIFPTGTGKRLKKRTCPPLPTLRLLFLVKDLVKDVNVYFFLFVICVESTAFPFLPEIDSFLPDFFPFL